MKTQNSRWSAAIVLTKVLDEGQSLTAVLDEVLPSIADAKDRAFIQALCYGVCRFYFRLNFFLGKLVNKPIKHPQIRMLALVGLYQLSGMRIKQYAAVSETVRSALGKPWAKGLLNAIFRGFLRERSVLLQLADAIPEARWSHPEWLIESIHSDWPQHAERIFQENNRQPPMALRVNLSRISRPEYINLLVEQGISAQIHDFCPSALILEQPCPVEMLPGFLDGLVSVQDIAAQLAAELLAPGVGESVLDICAAPGGKTAHILELQPELERLDAIDMDSFRLERVRNNLSRLHLSAQLIVADALKPQIWWDGRLYDRVLVDAPCSGLGVIRRHPDIKLLRRAEDVEPLVLLQQSILASVWPMLKRGGRLLYSTCSILKLENDRQIATFLSNHSDAAVLPIKAEWGIPSKYGRQIITGDSTMDGFYYACLEKR